MGGHDHGQQNPQDHSQHTVIDVDAK
jgi:hypothetical protein